MENETWEPQELEPSDIKLEETIEQVRPQTPEQNLMVAILQDAIESLSASTNPRNYNDARAYLLSDDEQWIFSFVSICQHLDLDPDCMRQGIFKRYFEKVFKQCG